MRRAVFGVLALVLVATVAVAAPAGATSSKTSYIVAECGRVTNPSQVDRFEVLPSGGVIIRGAHNTYDEYVRVGSVWMPSGTNSTVANVNINADGKAVAWGTFDFRSPMVGNFQGTWSWGASTYGRASGMSDDGKLLKVTLGLQGYTPPPGDCGVAEFVVLDTDA